MFLRSNCPHYDILEGLRLRFNKVGKFKLSDSDKLTLSGLVSALTILVFVGGGFAWLENRYATKSEIDALRCDVIMFHMAALELDQSRIEGEIPASLRHTLNSMETRWERMCAGRNN